MIDWANPDCQVTPHFTVRDCLWLDHWSRLATQDDGLNPMLLNVIEITCMKLENVRAILNIPLIVNSFFRSTEYSPLVGGGPHDVHTMGLAVDFNTLPYMSIGDAKDILKQHLEEMDLRMEKGTTTWIHIDRYRVGPSGREFTP